MKRKPKRKKAIWLSLPGAADWKRRNKPARTRTEARRREYARLRLLFLERRECQVCAVYPAKKATQVHHTRGRAGVLLLVQKWWVPVSAAGHQWIHANPEEARRRTWYGLPLLCKPGDWNNRGN